MSTGGARTDSGGGAGGGVAFQCTWIADFDGDGISDCARTQAGVSARRDLIFNKGTGQSLYLEASVVTAGVVPSNYVNSLVFDLNRDSYWDVIIGYPDPYLVASPPGASRVQLYRGQADGNFLPHDSPNPDFVGLGPVTGTFEGRQVGLADFDGDGHPDLLTMSFWGGPFYTTYWVVLSSAGGLNFKVTQSNALSPKGNTRVVAIVDLNGDGKLDIVAQAVIPPVYVPMYQNYVTVFLGDGAGSFAAVAPSVPGTDGSTDVSAADLNSDGKVDLLVTLPTGPTTLYGDGRGHFVPTPP